MRAKCQPGFHLNESLQRAFYHVSSQICSAVMAIIGHEDRSVRKVLAGGFRIVVAVALPQPAHLRVYQQPSKRRSRTI